MHHHGGVTPKLSLPGIRQVIAVASGKGGVGKSTVAANLALALAKKGRRVGLMDADIYGPSVPMMMGVGPVDPQTTQFPIEKYGLKLMSMGFVVPPQQAVIWRGPMVHKAVTDFLTKIPWGELDFLVIDFVVRLTRQRQSKQTEAKFSRTVTIWFATTETTCGNTWRTEYSPTRLLQRYPGTRHKPWIPFISPALATALA